MSTRRSVGYLAWACVGALASPIALGGAAAAGEMTTVRATSPWQGSGQVFDVGPDKRLILGRVTGILYLDGGKGALDSGLMLCPAMVRLDLGASAAEVSGHCTITDGETEDTVYSEWECKGASGGPCEGKLTITGGSGRFEGISGGGAMTFRAALVQTAVDLGDGTVVRDAAGLAVWPEIRFEIPSR
jgi:hypothetical protein